MIKKLTDLVVLAKSKRKKRIAVAAAGDFETMHALKKAQEYDIIEPVLVGGKQKIEAIAKEIEYDISGLELYDIEDRSEASLFACKLIRDNKADILMKGMVKTSELLKAVLNKKKGLRKGDVISHVAFFESPYYHKLLALTDAAMNVEPDFYQKIVIVNNAVEAFHLLGIKNPKVAIIGSIETINPKMEATMHAATLSMMNTRHQITGCVIDGPLALDNAVSKKSADLKGINSEVAGNCDLIVAPDINGANFLYKALNFLGGATSAAVIMGAKVPIVLTSRADSERCKLMSIALAAAMGD